MTFQVSTKQRYAPGIAGDFASANPRWNAVAGPGSLVAAAAGLIIARFCWGASAGANIITGETDFYNTVANTPVNNGPVVPLGFVAREPNQALITAFLAEASMTIPQGYAVTVASGGDFWVKNDGAGATAVGQKCYAGYLDGKVSTAAPATPPTNGLVTANLTSGSPTMTVTANAGAALAVGMPVSGTGIPAGTYIAALGTGTGGAGTYTLSANATATNTGVTVTATTAYETKWYAMSAAAATELFKMTSHAIG